jgi:cytochrome oxidase Cu insertion factor (SCO1/SenC/PrrC family)
MTFQSLVYDLLEKNAQELEEALQPLKQLIYTHTEMYSVSHDSKDTLLVYAPSRLKAYIPKKFNEWDVRFIAWSGDGSQVLDLDDLFLFNSD